MEYCGLVNGDIIKHQCPPIIGYWLAPSLYNFGWSVGTPVSHKYKWLERLYPCISQLHVVGTLVPLYLTNTIWLERWYSCISQIQVVGTLAPLYLTITCGWNAGTPVSHKYKWLERWYSCISQIQVVGTLVPLYLTNTIWLERWYPCISQIRFGWSACIVDIS